MFNFIAYCVSILVILLSIVFFYAKYKLAYWDRRGVKTPPTHILFGNFKDTLFFRKPPGKVLQEIYENADPDDPYIGFYIFWKPMLMIRDLNLVKKIFIKDFDVFPNRCFGGNSEIDAVGLVNLLGINQPRWKFLRSKLTPCLTGQKLRQMIPLMAECCKPFVDFIDDQPDDVDGSKKMELKKLCSRYSTDVFSSVAFGITTNSFIENNTPFWIAGQKILGGMKRGIILMITFFVPEVLRIIKPVITKPAKFFRSIFWDSMNTREKTGMKRGDMIDYFLKLKNEEQNLEFKFEDDNLLAQAVAFYVAGYEATSTAIAFTLFELANHPEYEARLYNEIQSVLNGEPLTMENINEMHFLHSVVNESLRIYPPLSLLDRVPVQDYELPGTSLVIEKGIPVYVSINGINQDEKYYFDPQSFIPSRMKNYSNEMSGSLAFGIGPRSCIGQRIGELITKVAIITIVSKYTLSYNQEKVNVFKPFTVFTNAANGVYVQLKKRDCK